MHYKYIYIYIYIYTERERERKRRLKCLLLTSIKVLSSMEFLVLGEFDQSSISNLIIVAIQTTQQILTMAWIELSYTNKTPPLPPLKPLSVITGHKHRLSVVCDSPCCDRRALITSSSSRVSPYINLVTKWPKDVGSYANWSIAFSSSSKVLPIWQMSIQHVEHIEMLQ